MTRRWRAALGWTLLIAVGLGLRLVGVGQPPLDSHHIRQSDTASVARIMCRERLDPLHPRIHWAGPEAGTVESELPLYALITALGWRAGGGCDGFFWPRLLSTLWWALGGLALALWLRRRSDAPAWPFLLLYAFSPLAIVFSRNIQPDSMGVCLMLWAMLAAEHAGAARRRPVALATAMGSGLLLGLAIAATGKAVFWTPLPLALMFLRTDRLRWPLVILALACAAALPSVWFWHANVHLGAEGATFGLWGTSSHKWGQPAVWLDLGTWRYIVGTLLSHTLTPLGVALCAGGVVLLRAQPGLWPFAAGLGLGLGSIVAVTEGYRLHDYYQLSLVPFASVLAGAALVDGWRTLAEGPQSWRVRASACLALLVLALSVMLGASFVRRSLELDRRVATTAAQAGAHVGPGAAVVVVDRHPQTVLFAMDRRGWHRTAMSFEDIELFAHFDAQYLLLTSGSESWQDAELRELVHRTWPRIAHGQGWRLYQLGTARQH